MSKLDAILNRWVRDRKKEAAPRWAAKDETPQADAAPAADPVSVIPGIDYAEGLKRMGGREDSYRRVLTSFANSIPALLDKLRGFSAESPGGAPEDALGAYTTTVHGIKGACYGISANNAGKQAEALEMAARRGDIETIQRDNAGFIRSAEKLAGDISAYLA